MRDFLGKIGERFFVLLAGLARLGELSRESLGYFWSKPEETVPIRRVQVVEQMRIMGVESLGIICLVGATVGMVLALQAAYQLKQFGTVLYTGSLVSVSMCRELGPLVAAIVIAGRIGARMAAELGTMKVQEEIDALRTMGLNPVHYLVTPRLIALLVMLPCLTVLADVMGMVGGFMIGTFGVGIHPYLYIAKNFDALVLKDIYTGLLKSVIFAFLIVLVSCHEGFSVRGGAEAVGKATTQAVVVSIMLIIVTDCIATAVFYYAFP